LWFAPNGSDGLGVCGGGRVGHAESEQPFNDRAKRESGPPAGELVGSELVRDLHGDLPCGRCRYNLRGLTVRGNCPECGLPIRVTLLAVVDPKAKELQPIAFPLATATGLVTWAAAGVTAVLGIWVLRGGDISGIFALPAWNPAWIETWLPRMITVCVALSGVGAIAFVRPHRRIPRQQVYAAAAGVLCYVPLTLITWRLHGVLDAAQPSPYFGTGVESVTIERSILRLMAGALIAAIALSLRPNGRLLVARSMLMRTGRVDRQTLLALAASAGVAAIGDALQLVSTYLPEGANELARLCGSLVIGLGSLLLTIGLVNLLIDVLRIRPVVVAAPLSLEAALGENQGSMADLDVKDSNRVR